MFAIYFFVLSLFRRDLYRLIGMNMHSNLSFREFYSANSIEFSAHTKKMGIKRISSTKSTENEREREKKRVIADCTYIKMLVPLQSMQSLPISNHSK